MSHMPIDGGPVPEPGTLQNLGAGAALYGQPVYPSGDGGFSLAKADAIGTAQLIGMVADVTIAAGAFGDIQSAGELEQPAVAWDAIAGTTGGLVFNTMYYLSPTVAGHYTSAPPSTVGQCLVPALIGLSSTRAQIVLVPPGQL